MKKVLLLAVLFIGVLVACQKSSDSLNHPTTYRVDGITDLTMGGDSGSMVSAIYNVEYIGPIQETVTLSFEDLPAGIMLDTSMDAGIVTTGIPKFQAYIRFVKTDTMDRKGTKKIKLVCTGSKTGKKWYDLTLTILSKTPTPPPPPIVHCDSDLAGTWDTCYDFCDITGTMFSNVISIDPTVANRIHFSNFKNYGVDIYADLDCAADTFVIPHQTYSSLSVGDGAVWGSGAWFSDNAMYYNIVDSQASGMNNCAGTLQRP